MKMDKHGHTYVQWMAALLANGVSLCYGFDRGWISPNIKYLQSDESPSGMPLSDNAINWIACALSMTATVGVTINTYVVEAYGSKKGVIFLCIVEVFSWLTKILSSSAPSLILARVIAGIVAGGIFNVIPMYVKEISQNDIRGILGSLVVLMQNVGILIMYLMGAYMKYYTVLYISLILPILIGILMLKAPESPAFLVKQGKIKEATKAIALLRGLDESDEIVQNELEYLENEEARFKTFRDISIIEIGV